MRFNLNASSSSGLADSDTGSIVAEDERFLPGRHELDAYGNHGFRFGGMSHRGSILAMPSGIRAWPVADSDGISLASLEPAVAEAAAIDLLLVGTGERLTPLDPDLLAGLRAAGLRIDVMSTATAARTYNFLVSENRYVAAALIAVP